MGTPPVAKPVCPGLPAPAMPMSRARRFDAARKSDCSSAFCEVTLFMLTDCLNSSKVALMTVSPSASEIIISSSVKPRVVFPLWRIFLLVVSRNVLCDRVNLGSRILGNRIADVDCHAAQCGQRIPARVKQRRDRDLALIVRERKDHVIGGAQNAVGARFIQ